MNGAYVPERGDLVWIDFSPQSGREQGGRRPALVLSPRSYNRRTRLALMCPITSQVKGYLTEVALPLALQTRGVVLADHLRSLDWTTRATDFIEQAPPELLEDVMHILQALLPPTS